MQYMKILSCFYLLVTLTLTGCDGSYSEDVLPLAVSQAMPPNTAPVAGISLGSEAFVASTEVSFTGAESSDAEDDHNDKEGNAQKWVAVIVLMLIIMVM